MDTSLSWLPTLSDEWRVLLVVLLLAINAFFVAVEFALVRVRRTRMQELAEAGHLRARDVLAMHQQLDSYLSACQLGVTAASLGLGWVGEPVVSALLTPVIDPILSFAGAPQFTRGTALALGFLLITSLHIVVGEQAPKILAIQRSEAVSMLGAVPLRVFYLLTGPLVSVLNAASNALCRLMGIDPTAAQETHTGQELKMILTQSKDASTHAARDVVTRALDFSKRTVREVMVPRGEVVFINTQKTFQQNLQMAMEAGFTRFPLCDGDLDRTCGMIHLRDLLEPRLKTSGSALLSPDVDLKSIARRAKYMPEQMTLSNALKEFQRTRTHQAMVVDEYGGTVGLLALEDVLETLVGPIQDEFDEEQPLIEGLGRGVVRVDGSTPLVEVNAALGLDIQDSHNGTVGGHLTMLLGRIAQVGDRLRVGSYDVLVEHMSGLAVGQVSFVPRVEKRQDSSPSPAGEGPPHPDSESEPEPHKT
jgi:CBS domain containing-hemolysin-like protein